MFFILLRIYSPGSASCDFSFCKAVGGWSCAAIEHLERAKPTGSREKLSHVQNRRFQSWDLRRSPLEVFVRVAEAVVLVDQKIEHESNAKSRSRLISKMCSRIVRGKARAAYHKRDQRGERHIPIIGMDYMYMGSRGQNEHTPILVVKDDRRKAVCSMPVPCKGRLA